MVDQTSHLASPTFLIVLLLLGAICYAIARWWDGRHPPPTPPSRGGESDTRPTLAGGLQGGYSYEVLTVGVLVLAWLGFFWQPFFIDNIWLPRGGGDFTSFYYPLYSYASRALQEGLPLWNPTLYSGMPYVADLQTAALYPPNLLALTAGRLTYAKLELLVMAHYLWASVTMYLFLRHGLRLMRPAAVIGGIAFAYCGFMTAHFGHLPMVPVASWLPLSLLAVQRAIVPSTAYRVPGISGRLKWSAVAGLSLAISVLAGHPQIFFYSALTVVAWAIYLIAINWRSVGQNNRQSIIYNLQSIVPAGLIFALIAGPQLLLSNELGGESIRSGISYDVAANSFSTTPIGLVSLVLPHVWGSNPQNYWGVDTWASTETWAYSGVITLLLALFAVVEFRRLTVRSGVAIFFAGLALASLLLTLGGQTVVFGWLFEALPGWDRFRSVGRLLLPFSIGVSVLAALGAGRLLALAPHPASPARGEAQNADPRADAEDVGAGLVRPTLEQSNSKIQNLSFGLLLAALLITLLPLPIFLARVTTGEALDRAIPFVNDTVLLILWLLLSAGLLWFARRLSGRMLTTLLTLLLVVDLFSVNAAFNPGNTSNVTGFQHPDALAFLTDGGSRFNNRDEVFRIDSDTGVGGIWQPSLAAKEGFEDAGGIYNPLRPRRYDELWQRARQDRNSALYDMFNIKFVIGLTDTKSLIGQGFIEDSRLEKVLTTTKGLGFYYNPGALPRAFLVHIALVEPNQQRQFERMTDGSLDPRNAVLLESGEPLRGKLAGSARYAELSGSNPATGEAATIEQYDTSNPDYLRIQSSLKEDGYLVVGNVYYPGWQATVDGQPATIQRANYAFQAIRLSAGQHTVELRFEPGLWRPGLVAMGLGGLLALGLLLWPGRRRR